MKLTLTGRQRLELAALFFKWKPAGSDILNEIKNFGRTRLALGLTPIMDCLTAKKPMNPERVTDVPLAFHVSDEGVDLLLQCVLPKIADSANAAYQATILGDLVETLQIYKTVKQDPEVNAPDYVAEDWSFDDINREVLVEKRILALLEVSQLSINDLVLKLVAIDASQHQSVGN